jgi:hypothetical protein
MPKNWCTNLRWGGITLKSLPGKDDLVMANPSIEHETKKVMGVVERALTVFGGDGTPVAPPSFAASRDIEDHLGHGHF